MWVGLCSESNDHHNVLMSKKICHQKKKKSIIVFMDNWNLLEILHFDVKKVAEP